MLKYEIFDRLIRIMINFRTNDFYVKIRLKLYTVRFFNDKWIKINKSPPKKYLQKFQNLLSYAPLKRKSDGNRLRGSLAQSVEQRTFNPLVESSSIGPGFESLTTHHFCFRSRGCLAQLGEHLPYKERVIGSIPIATTTFGSLAQLVEQLTLNQLVPGSNP